MPVGGRGQIGELSRTEQRSIEGDTLMDRSGRQEFADGGRWEHSQVNWRAGPFGQGAGALGRGEQASAELSCRVFQRRRHRVPTPQPLAGRGWARGRGSATTLGLPDFFCRWRAVVASAQGHNYKSRSDF